MEFFQTNFIVLLLWLVAGHFIGDFVLQNDYMAKAKNPNSQEGANGVWRWVMSAHCATHAAIVGLITGSTILALFEFFCHFFIDTAKCENQLTYHQDQRAHLICKLIIAIVFVSFF